MASSGTNFVVAAIDFGTTYSGYAFSFRDDPLRVQTNRAWHVEIGAHTSMKTPTSLLLDAEGRFDSFGYEAENRYSSRANVGQHHDWRLFRHFKMMLYDNKVCIYYTAV